MAVDINIQRSDSLHELNIGEYLNLFGTQEKLKIGFIVNKDPSSVKIFKHLQMSLNLKYSIDNIYVKTSLDQELTLKRE